MSNTVPSLREFPNWGGGFPGEHEFSTLADLENSDGQLDEALEATDMLIDRWHGNKFAMLYLHGTPGLGKTHLAIGLGRALAERQEWPTAVTYLHAPSVHKSEYKSMSDFQNDPIMSDTNYGIRHCFSNSIVGVGDDGHIGSVPRSRNAALIFDDYQPERQRQFFAAVGAAAEFGGLIIATSNYDDPLKFTETPPEHLTDEEIAMRDVASHLDPDAVKARADMEKNQQLELSASMYSRIGAATKFVHLESEDHRPEKSFWA